MFLLTVGSGLFYCGVSAEIMAAEIDACATTTAIVIMTVIAIQIRADQSFLIAQTAVVMMIADSHVDLSDLVTAQPVVVRIRTADSC